MNETDIGVTDEDIKNIVFERKAKIAYFSMEIGIKESIPTYSGGLGILAGDTLKSCADLGVPVIGITLLSEKGYFRQEIDEQGNQIEHPVNFPFEDILTVLPKTVSVNIEAREVKIRAWVYEHKGEHGYKVPIIFLDTNIEPNSQKDREITKYLYGGDEYYRLSQEIVLGIGGMRMIEALGHNEIDIYHMNEGHAALSTLELFFRLKDIQMVREKCVFTTHTPVAAGHDQFEINFAKSIIGGILPDFIIEDITTDGKLNMTKLALFFSHYINGVAKKHGEVSRMMFPGYSIDSITNGVHATTWTSPSFKELFDKYISGWRADPFILRSAFGINADEIWAAHAEAKKVLIDFVNQIGSCGMNYTDFTIGFARRQTAYKRPDLLVAHPEKLIEISKKVGTIQVIYSGKAHPKDYSGKEAIKKICQLTKKIDKDLKIYFIPDYDINIARMMVAGVDLWLNTPQRPNEASGTSGMKAACNGVPQLGTMDGWWIEGCIEDVTGWSIGSENVNNSQLSDYDADMQSLYSKLENKIVSKFYNDRADWIRIMRRCIAINGSFFNTNRMVQQYVLNAYFK